MKNVKTIIFNKEEKAAAAAQRPYNLAKLYDAGYLKHGIIISNGEAIGAEREDAKA